MHGQLEPPAGSLVTHLRSFPIMKLVAGPWGDLSVDFHVLLGIFSKNKAATETRSKGRSGGPSSGELGKGMNTSVSYTHLTLPTILLV